ncbi:MAG: hypothetical protein SVY10_14165 [Thermodesulfobacteriota bacterium]|nr:hypothetical protein [Thermodesulfobacteriota bacterium]
MTPVMMYKMDCRSIDVKIFNILAANTIGTPSKKAKVKAWYNAIIKMERIERRVLAFKLTTRTDKPSPYRKPQTILQNESNITSYPLNFSFYIRLLVLLCLVIIDLVDRSFTVLVT